MGRYRGSLSTVHNDEEISTCGWIIEVHSVQSKINDEEISTCGQIIEIPLQSISSSNTIQRDHSIPFLCIISTMYLTAVLITKCHEIEAN